MSLLNVTKPFLGLLGNSHVTSITIALVVNLLAYGLDTDCSKAFLRSWIATIVVAIPKIVPKGRLWEDGWMWEIVRFEHDESRFEERIRADVFHPWCYIIMTSSLKKRRTEKRIVKRFPSSRCNLAIWFDVIKPMRGRDLADQRVSKILSSCSETTSSIWSQPRSLALLVFVRSYLATPPQMSGWRNERIRSIDGSGRTWYFCFWREFRKTGLRLFLYALLFYKEY